MRGGGRRTIGAYNIQQKSQREGGGTDNLTYVLDTVR